MDIVIVGGGQTGFALAEVLTQEKQVVAVVEKDRARAQAIAAEGTVRVVEGDGCDPKVLREAGISSADAVVAVTGHDEDNLVVCTLARFEFNVPRTIARINNPRNQWMFGKDLGVDIALSQAHLMARLLEEEVTVGELVTLLKLREGEVSLVEETINKGSRAVGHSISELALPPNTVCVAILREGRVLLPTAEVVLQPGDEVVALTGAAEAARLGEALS